MEEKWIWTIIAILIIIALALFGKNLGLFSIYSYEKQIDFMGYEAIAYSSYEFGSFHIIERCDSSDVSSIKDIKNEVSYDTLDISSSKGYTGGGVRCLGGPEDVETYIETQNLNLNSSNLQKLEMVIEQSSSIGCTDNIFQQDGGVLIYLNDIVIFQSNNVRNRQTQQTQQAGKITILYLSGNTFQVITPDGNSKLIDLNGNYELKIKADSFGSGGACNDAGGGASEYIKIHSINIDTQMPFCNTLADTNCDSKVDRTELGFFITKWIAGTVTRDELGQAIVAWIETG